MMTKFKTWYMDEATFNLAGVIETAQERLADVDFDTLVGTGFSGSIVIPALALAMGKKFVLIRKETDDSHHGKGRLVGQLGARWIFVDDFVSSGVTRKRVIEKISAAHDEAKRWETVTPTEMVGQYMYQAYRDDNYDAKGRFEDFRSDWAELGW
jgi:orotate phosphoribosyltransferase